MKDIHKAQWFKEAMVVPYTISKGAFFQRSHNKSEEL